jgi:hypothetical protein
MLRFWMPRRRRLEVRQLGLAKTPRSAAFLLHLTAIFVSKSSIHKGASKLAHSKGFASDKNYAALSDAAAEKNCPPHIIYGSALYFDFGKLHSRNASIGTGAGFPV